MFLLGAKGSNTMMIDPSLCGTGVAKNGFSLGLTSRLAQFTPPRIGGEYSLLSLWWYHYSRCVGIELSTEEVEDLLKQFGNICVASIRTVKQICRQHDQ